jgi:light-regulated signal transduction histidine kinase (bacteriophytochrome)
MITQQRHRKKDGSILNVESTVYETILDQRNVVVEICTQLFGRGPLEEKFDRLSQELDHRVRERTNQLEATNRELEAFCYSVSHDLKAPLRSILGFSEVLLERYSGRLDGRGQELLRRVCESSQTMDRLIEDLLKLSRVARVELQRRPVNLSALAEKIAGDLKGADPSRKVRFIIPKELNAHGDERLLEMVLDNLLRNAWKFTSKRPDPVIELGATDGPKGEFFVHDNGVGFDMAFAHKLFGVFQRLHSPSEFSGTGVGLAIVQRIINRHGGTTRAEGKVGQGATFYFTLHSGSL